MAKRLINLSGVSLEEANDIRNLLNVNRLSFYETPRGNWGESMAAIWLNNDTELEYAKKILSEYYKNQESINKSTKENEYRHKNIEFVKSIKNQPIAFMVFLSIAVIIVGAMFYAIFQAF
jgi:hypothetical protein